MSKKFFVFIFISFVLGCQTIPPRENLPSRSTNSQEKQSPQATAPAAPQSPEIIPEEVPPRGMIFAKTEFEGVVKKSYVRLTIIDNNDQSKSYQLYIGDKSRQLDFPWSTETIQPGYFFIDLPVGTYTIASLAIPVGSTLASEVMNISFEVKPEKTCYLGTLRVVGTKEKIKLGGIPVIKPRFEYIATILDEYNEAAQEFKQRFSEKIGGLDIDLMKDMNQKKWTQEGPVPRSSTKNFNP